MLPHFSLSELELVDAPAEREFDNLTALASSVLGAPISLVSLVETVNDRQYFKSAHGLSEPWATQRQTPLSHSFCRHVVEDNATFIVEDAVAHDRVSANLAVVDLNVKAYLGAPVHDPARRPVGALCVIDAEARQWSRRDVETLEMLAACVSDAIRLKASLKTSEAVRQEQGDFTYAISHDLMAPVNSLDLLLREIGEESAAERARDGTDDAAEPAGGDALDDLDALMALSFGMVDRMRGLIEDVLEYTRSIGKEGPHQLVDMNALAAGVCEELHSAAQEAGAIIDVADLPEAVGDAFQLSMLFRNLVGNAIKFRRAGMAPRIAISGCVDRNDICWSVMDDGIGMVPEHAKKIFGMFQRLHVRSEFPGTGIGLALCKRIADNHGGRIDVRSVSGQGSTFTLRLPAKGAVTRAPS